MSKEGLGYCSRNIAVEILLLLGWLIALLEVDCGCWEAGGGVGKRKPPVEPGDESRSVSLIPSSFTAQSTCRYSSDTVRTLQIVVRNFTLLYFPKFSRSLKVITHQTLTWCK